MKQVSLLFQTYIFTSITILCFLSLRGMEKPIIWCFAENSHFIGNIEQSVIKTTIQKLKTLYAQHPHVFYTLHKKCINYPQLDKGDLLFLIDQEIINSDNSVPAFIKELMNAMIHMQGASSWVFNSFEEFTDSQKERILQSAKTMAGITITQKTYDILYQNLLALLDYPSALIAFHKKCKDDSTCLLKYPQQLHTLRNLKLVTPDGSIPPLIQRVATKALSVSLDTTGKPQAKILSFNDLREKGLIKPYR